MVSPVCRKAADLRGADVDVVGAREVRSVGGSQEAEAVGQHFERAVAEDRLALLRLVLEHGEDQVLLAQAVGAVDAVQGRLFQEFGDVEGF